MNQRITIAGGGLAGLSLASALRHQQVPVTILESGSYPRHRVCGEFISGVTPETLEALGIAAHFRDAHQHRSVSWYDCGKIMHCDLLETPAIGISRYLLDERLREHIQSLGAIIKTNTRAQPTPQDGLVWAAGRRPRNGSWIGLKAHIRDLPMTADLEMHVGKNGYAGLATVEDGWTNVCGLFRLDRSLPAKGSELLPAYLEAGGNHQLAQLLRAGEWRENSFSAVAGFELGHQIIIPGLLTLGDAESMIPPFTGNGMSMAFQSAECAIEPLVAWSKGKQSWQQATQSVQAVLKQKFTRRLAMARLIHPILLSRQGRFLIQKLAATRLLPFQSALALVR